MLPAIVGDGDARTTLVVQEFRLPGVVLGLLAGAAIGIAGGVASAAGVVSAADVAGAGGVASAAGVAGAAGVASAGGVAGAGVPEPGGRVALAAPFAAALLVLVWPTGGAPLALVAVLTVVGALALRQPAAIGLAALVMIGALAGLLAGGDGPQPGRWLESGLEYRGWSWVLPFAIAVAVLIPLALRHGVVAATGLAALAVATVGSIALVALPAAALGRTGGIGAAALAGVTLVLAGDLLAGAGIPVPALAAVSLAATAALVARRHVASRRAPSR